MSKTELEEEQKQILELFEKIRRLTNGKRWVYSKLQEIHGNKISIHLTILDKDLTKNK